MPDIDIHCPAPASSAANTPKPAGAFRVIHTSDWHLGKTLGELDRAEEHRRFLNFLRRTIVATGTDALVIAGDVFDSATPPQSAVRLYFDFLAALHQQSQCVVVITAGNHDSPGHLEAAHDVLHAINVRITATLPEDRSAALIPLPSAQAPQLLIAAVPFLRERDLRTGYLGQSVAEIQADLQEGLQKRYAEIAAASQVWPVPVLVTGHLTALGSSVSESEREIHVGGLGAIGADAFPADFDYVALGHLHRPQAVGGRPHIRYSGSPIALSFSEATDTKELRLLDFTGGQLTGNAAIAVPTARPLVQLRIPQAELEERLRAFTPPPGDAENCVDAELTPWVEVIIQNAGAGQDLYRTVQEIAAGQHYQVVCVRVERDGAAPSLRLGDNAETEADGLEDLLADPKTVFLRRLSQEPGYDDSERAVLGAAFDELSAI